MMVYSYQLLVDNGNNRSSTCIETTKLPTNLTKNMNETSESTNQEQQRRHQTDTDTSETINVISDCGNHGDVRKNEEIMCGPSLAKGGSNDQTISSAEKLISNSENTASDSARVCKDKDESTVDEHAQSYGHDSIIFHNGLTDIVGYSDEKCSSTKTEKTSSKLSRSISSVSKETVEATSTKPSTSCNINFSAQDECVILGKESGDDEADGDTGTGHRASAVRVVDWYDQRSSNKAPLPMNFATITISNTNKREFEYSDDDTSINKSALSAASTTTANKVNRSVSDNSRPDMESRKVEPLRININREPIKTKIKLGQQPQASTLSPTTATTQIPSFNIDTSEDMDKMTPRGPKITIKPIRPPPYDSQQHIAFEQKNDDSGNNEKNHHRYHSHNHRSGTLMPSTTLTTTASITTTQVPTPMMETASVPTPAMVVSLNHYHSTQEAIPKLKIKVDSTSNTLQSLSSFNATNSSSCSSISNSSSSSISQVQNSSGEKEAISLVSDEGVKVTLKPLAEPPLPKLTIKTNTATDTAEVVTKNNTSSSKRTEYLTAHTISSSSNSNTNTAEDNSSTCSSGSTSSFSSNHSSTAAVSTSSDIKLIIKATSTGGSCVVAGDAKKSIKQSKLVDALRTASPVQKSSTRGSAKSVAAVTASAVTTADEDIVIPKVTIKPVLNPNDGPDVCSSEQPRVTPKIILKPIPKPIEKPLEIITAPGSPFSRSCDANESQQSPRIILKINKNATSQTTEAILLTKPSLMLASQSPHTTMAGSAEAQTNSADSYMASPRSSNAQNDLKRMNHASAINVKKLKLMPGSEDDDDIVHLLSSDSESEVLNPSVVGQSPPTPVAVIAPLVMPMAEQTSALTPNSDSSNSLNVNSDLRSILSRPQMKIPPPLQNFASQSSNILGTLDVSSFGDINSASTMKVTAMSTKTASADETEDVIDLCHDSNEDMKMQINSDLASKMQVNYNDSEASPHDSSDTAASTSSTKVQATSVPSAVLPAMGTTINETDQNQHNSDKSPSTYKWPFLYGIEEKRPESSIHPLLKHNIARANVLEAMMTAASNRDICVSANGATNFSTQNDTNLEKSLRRKSELLLENDGSSSDCIVIEDTGSEPFPFGSSDKITDQNGQKKESMDRDSGVDVSSSMKSTSGDGHDEDVLPVKRPRGRPRKDGTPAGSLKGANSKKQQQLLQLQQQNDDFAKCKFASALVSQQNSSAQKLIVPKVILQKIPTNNLLSTSTSSTPIVLHKKPLFAGQQTTILTASGTMTITSTTVPTSPHLMHSQAGLAENKISIVPIQPIVTPAEDEPPLSLQSTPSKVITKSVSASDSAKNLIPIPLAPIMQLPSVLSSSTSPYAGNSQLEQAAHNTDANERSLMTRDIAGFGEIEAKMMTATATSITTQSEAVSIPSVPTTMIETTTAVAAKERKRRIIIDDDDESPTFNPLSRSNKRLRGRGRRRRCGLLRHQKMYLLSSPEKASAAISDLHSTITNINAIDTNVFTSPEEIDRRKFVFKDATSTPPLQLFEEETCMSADSLLPSPNRNTEFLQNDESQSSLQSSTSATVEGSMKKIRSKIEVADPEGKTEFTVDMIAEYDWPPPKGCCPSRNRDTFMIQEQIAEYLGVKSFKRKYPDLPRRMVEMEERNYLMEKGMVSEKMCDLGLTAVLASDVLDIMHTDFYERYEEYRRFLREKQIRDLAARQKTQQSGVVGKNLSVRENAMRAAAAWNCSFNKSRKENRRECLDLQNFIIHIPGSEKLQPDRPLTKPSSYPLALVPGQFQEYYRKHSAAELLCYPINTVIADPYQLDWMLRDYCNRSRYINSDSDSDSEDGSDSASSSDDNSSDFDTSTSSTSDSSSDDEDEYSGEKKSVITAASDLPSSTLATQKLSKSKTVNKEDRNKCKVCNGVERCNRNNRPEIFVRCSICHGDAHPSCIEMPSKMVKRVNEYAWQCSVCKHCIKCRRSEDEDKMLYCDQCDRGYHIYCIGLRKVPNGQWHCAVCTVCTMCGARRPEGHNNPNLTPQQKQKLLAVAKWTHEYQMNPTSNAQEHNSMLCTSCVAIKHSASKNVYYN